MHQDGTNNHDYSFSVAVKVVLPEGTLTKDQQTEMIERAQFAAQKSVEEYVRTLKGVKEGTMEKPWWMRTYGE
ncbi:hypothetical protein [Streptomyces levis]|uniref:hypothetical protein n=1 Tax=Streptomyces levis TaxID=285566 RepID=UPI0031D3DAA4